jgi:hypothetical protein
MLGKFIFSAMFVLSFCVTMATLTLSAAAVAVELFGP